MPGLRASDVGDGGDGDARHPHGAAGVVLGGLSGGHPSPGDLSGAAQAPAGHRPLRHRVADPAQAAPGNGRPRTPRAHRPRRSRRLLRRRHRGRPSWRAKVRFEQGDRCRRGRAARRGLGAPAPERDPRPLRRLAVRLRHRGRGSRRGGAHRWLAGLPASRSPGLRAPPVKPTPNAGRRVAPAARAPLDLQPQGLAARHPPRRLARAPAGLPGRVRLSP